jgi:hypothetical protein
LICLKVSVADRVPCDADVGDVASLSTVRSPTQLCGTWLSTQGCGGGYFRTLCDAFAAALGTARLGDPGSAAAAEVLAAGREAACGWLGAGPADGVIGCDDEADSSTGWVTLLASVSPGDMVTVTMDYAQAGRMRCKVTDLDTGATATEDFKGPTGENGMRPISARFPQRLPQVTR